MAGIGLIPTLAPLPASGPSPEMIDLQRKYAAALLNNRQPIAAPSQGIEAILEGIMGARGLRRADAADAAANADAGKASAAMIAALMGPSAPASPGSPAIPKGGMTGWRPGPATPAVPPTPATGINALTPEQIGTFIANPRIADGIKTALLTRMTPKGPGEPFTLAPGETRFGPDGKPIATGAPKTDDPTGHIKEYEFAKGQGYNGTFADYLTMLAQAGASKITNNVGPTGIDYGKPPDGYAWARDDKGNVKVDPKDGAPFIVPIHGGKVEADAAAAADAAASKDVSKTLTSNLVLDDIGRALTIAQKNPTWTTGLLGDLAKGVGGSDARDLAGLLKTIKANISFDRLQKMREESPTGGALGNVSEGEGAKLESVYGDLEQSQSAEQFQYNLRRLNNLLLDTVHGPGKGPARMTLDGSEAPKPGKSGVLLQLPDGSYEWRPVE